MLFNPRRRLEAHLVEALDGLRLELSSIKGRWRSPKIIDTQGFNYLQLGSWEDAFPGFLNTDHFVHLKGGVGLDIRFPLPFRPDTWAGVYAHHVVEHISYSDALALFREIHRVLKPNGTFRMVVPDLECFLRAYQSTASEERQKIMTFLPPHAMAYLSSTITTPLEMVDYIFRDSNSNRHLSSWDWETAELRLKEAGFAKVIRQTVNKSVDTQLAGHDKQDWADHSLYIEAVKA